jgi:hypothetical protein
MREIVDNLLAGGSLEEARKLIFERMNQLVEEKLDLLELDVADKLSEDLSNIFESQSVQKMGRTKIIRVRIRKGKVQRRIRKSTVKGYEMKHGSLSRMSYQERRHRKMGARLAKFKRRSHQAQTNIKRQRTAMRRKGLGL